MTNILMSRTGMASVSQGQAVVVTNQGQHLNIQSHMEQVVYFILFFKFFFKGKERKGSFEVIIFDTKKKHVNGQRIISSPYLSILVFFFSFCVD